MKTNCAFLDTDIIMKLGNFKKVDLLSKVLMSLDKKLFVHEYIVNEELQIGENALRQFKDMVNSSEITIMTEAMLSISENQDYQSALNVLSTEMNVNLSKLRDKNAGEVKSMAMAYAKEYQYFISDDKEARVVAKRHLQGTDNTYLGTIRLNDIIKHLRENLEEIEISRKTAKRLYLYMFNPKFGRDQNEKKKIEKAKIVHAQIFDNELWPVK